MGDSNGGWGEAAAVSDEFAAVWDGYALIPEPGTNPALDAFVGRKGITHRSLIRIGARMADTFVLAFIFPGGIKFRDLVTDRRWSYAESEWTQLKIVRAGRTPTETVIVAEGETDACWLTEHGHVDVAVLPAGADPRPHTTSYVRQLASYKLVLLGQDADRAGDEGAKLLAAHLPQAVRYPPPENPDHDWCGCGAETLPEFPVTEAPRKRLVPLGELLDLEPPNIVSWYENGLLPVAGQLIIHGWAKSFKSFLALDLLASLAQGIPWCGFEPTEEPCKVAVAQYEITWPYYQQRMLKLAAQCPEPTALKENFFTLEPMRRPDLVAGDTEKEDRVLRDLEEAGASVFLLDPVRRATGSADLNSEKDVRLLLNFFQRCQDNGITVVACHHDNKEYARAGGGNPLGMTGAGAFSGDADTIVSVSVPRGLTLESPTRNLHFTTRNAPIMGARAMTMTEAGVLTYATSPAGGDPDVPEDSLPKI